MTIQSIVLWCEYCQKNVIVTPQSSVVMFTDGPVLQFLIIVDLSCPECDHTIKHAQGWIE